jgi:hypothetical protein
MKVMAKLTTNRLDTATQPFAFSKLLASKLCRLAVFGRYRKLKSLFGKQLLLKRLRQIRPVSQQNSAVISSQLRQHFDVVNIGRGQFECLKHTQRVDFCVQPKSIKSLIANLFSISGNASKKPAESGPGEAADRDRKAVDHGNSICESLSNMLKKPFLNKPEVGCMSREINPVSQSGKVVVVESLEESKDVFISVESEDFADNFYGKYFTVSHLRKQSSGSERSTWKEIFHKIISFAEDIYDKIIKVHFLALRDQWNNFCSFTYLFHRPEGLFVTNRHIETYTRR